MSDAIEANVTLLTIKGRFRFPSFQLRSTFTKAYFFYSIITCIFSVWNPPRLLLELRVDTARICRSDRRWLERTAEKWRRVLFFYSCCSADSSSSFLLYYTYAGRIAATQRLLNTIITRRRRWWWSPPTAPQNFLCGLSLLPPVWKFHVPLPLSSRSIILPLHMSKPFQPSLSNFTSMTCFLISNPVLSGPSNENLSIFHSATYSSSSPFC